MSRPIKKGLDYFPVDTTISRDPKIRRIKRKCGAEAFMLYLTLLCDIYANSFYVQVDEDYLFDLSEQMQMTESEVMEIILEMVKVGLFDSRLFQKGQILTSASIQKRYFAAKGKRSASLDNHDLSFVLEKIDSDKTPVLQEETPKNDDLSAQSKVQKNTVQENTVQKNTVQKSTVQESTVQESTVQESKKFERERVRESESERECVRARERWMGWKGELLADEEWRASVVRQSGQGIGFDDALEGKIDEFCDFIISCGEQETVAERPDFVRRFHYWLSYHETTKREMPANKQKKGMSKFEEMNRVGEESLEMAKQILSGQCW